MTENEKLVGEKSLIFERKEVLTMRQELSESLSLSRGWTLAQHCRNFLHWYISVHKQIMTNSFLAHQSLKLPAVFQ